MWLLLSMCFILFSFVLAHVVFNASVSGIHVRNAAVASSGTDEISFARSSLTARPDLPCIFGPHRRPSDARRGTPGVAARNIAVACPGTGEALR
jgi:hypothetical protein